MYAARPFTHSEAYSDASFWAKLRRFSVRAGYEVVEKTLWLYYAAQKPDIPVKAKAVIWSALGYFILPVDAIPDVTPLIGFSDDLTVLTAALVVVATHVDAEVKAKASAKLSTWFPERRF